MSKNWLAPQPSPANPPTPWLTFASCGKLASMWATAFLIGATERKMAEDQPLQHGHGAIPQLPKYFFLGEDLSNRGVGYNGYTQSWWCLFVWASFVVLCEEHVFCEEMWTSQQISPARQPSVQHVQHVVSALSRTTKLIKPLSKISRICRARQKP